MSSGVNSSSSVENFNTNLTSMAFDAVLSNYLCEDDPDEKNYVRVFLSRTSFGIKDILFERHINKFSSEFFSQFLTKIFSDKDI